MIVSILTVLGANAAQPQHPHAMPAPQGAQGAQKMACCDKMKADGGCDCCKPKDRDGTSATSSGSRTDRSR